MGDIGEFVENPWTVQNRWTFPVPKNRLRRRKISDVLREKAREYCESSSLGGYRYLVEPKRSWIERAIWIILHGTTLCLLGLLVHSAYREYRDVPVISVVESDNYPSTKLLFPAIALCNINRISRRAAVELANEIVTANVTSLGFKEVLQLIRHLGSLYESASDTTLWSEKYLDALLLQHYKGNYDVTSIMKSLSPTCEEGLLTCFYQSEQRNCSEIFAFRKTQDGYCCTFNYIRERDDIMAEAEREKEKPQEPYTIQSFGLANGLSLVIEPNIDDYYYPILPTVGWKLTVFSPDDYPDTVSGSVCDALLAPTTETFVELDVSSFFSTDEIRGVPVEERKCIFQDELPVSYTGYTYSDCLVDCRAAVIWDTCRCRPFYFPRRGNDQNSRKVCTTAHTECLASNKEIYWTVLSNKVKDSEEEVDSKFFMNAETAKLCSNCFPACNDVRYYLQSSMAYLDKEIYRTELLNNVRLENQSIMHIYFEKHESVRLKQTAAYHWYELLSNVGGICGVFIGFSLISVVEFLYFTLGIFHEFCRGKRKPIATEITTGATRRTRTGTKWRTRESAKPFDGTLYWNEFLGHNSVTARDEKIKRFQVRRY